jgi:Family of unknown function (DUF5996)
MSEPNKAGAVPSGAASPESHDAGSAAMRTIADIWPSLAYEEWKDTYETLHMWTQVVGKIRLALSPAVNHWWHVTLYVTPSGLTTSPIPYATRIFEISFNFIDHNLIVHTSDGATGRMGLYPRSVADFYNELMSILRSLGIDVQINTIPQEVSNPIACDVDMVHASYDAGYANRFHRILVQTDRVFKEFRGHFLGKCSPVHFFWGGFDLAVTRFSGRRAPARPGADRITREGYSHECSSVGFWPGSGGLLAPAYYAYTVPEPAGLSNARVLPDGAYYDSHMQEFFLRYDDVRNAADPAATLLDFLQTTYAAGADLAGWDRHSLERESE